MSSENGKLVTRGWFLGLGLIFPIVIATVVGGYLNTAIYRFLEKSQPDEYGYESYKKDYAKDIAVESFHDTPYGKKVIILGVVVNNGKDTVSSVTVEAEFFNEKGEFVYEKSNYIRRKLKTGERENFQVACGCNGSDFPDYKTVTVRVTEASNY